MQPLVIHPENSDQLTAIKAILKVLKVPYESQEEVSLPKVTKTDIDKAYNGHREGLYTVVEGEDLWK
ncbi:DUF2683 family protein [Pedobacter duraquae]|uniref:Uncharacterized protein n=1 Tax=Pedobacter duraquae TaxID=425511 RepID=A0A4R6II30_9SPHI|nr:DUF2683 family protein [Pedobacter duraquae]TDO21586.1 hypothetical protein CLV32_2691 [Pedobacter duraquae]